MGPLKGFRVIEMAGIGPAPFCGMMLADMGAEVIRVDRREKADLGLDRAPRFEIMNRGRKSVAVDIKKPEAVEIIFTDIKKHDWATGGILWSDRKE